MSKPRVHVPAGPNEPQGYVRCLPSGSVHPADYDCLYPRYAQVTLYCVSCRAKLGVLALEDQTRDGRIICAKCRMGEQGRLQGEEESLKANLWIVGVLVVCVLAWVGLYLWGASQ